MWIPQLIWSCGIIFSSLKLAELRLEDSESSGEGCAVCVRGGGTSYMWHSTDVCAEWPPFSALHYILYMTDLIFLDWNMKGPTFSDIPVYAHIFYSEIFETAWYSLVFSGLQYLSITSNK